MADIKHWETNEPWLKMDCGLGEAPFYEPYSGRLRFVDIVKKKLHSVDISEGQTSLATIDLKDAVGITADIEAETGKTCIVGAKYGYALMDRESGSLTYIAKLWNPSDGEGKAERMRFNDGSIDSHGRFWAGTMNDPLVVSSPKPEGYLFRLDPTKPKPTLRRIIANVTIPNGTGWSPDDKMMYFTDSPSRSITVFDFDASSGDITKGRVFFKVSKEEPEDAVPDGLCVDVDGYVWTALHGAGKVVRVNPLGKVVGEVKVPARSVTCPRLVGKELFITSSEEEDPEKWPESAKVSGSVFRVEVGVQGMSINTWKGGREAVD